jgi:hypothetical protein
MTPIYDQQPPQPSKAKLIGYAGALAVLVVGISFGIYRAMNPTSAPPPERRGGYLETVVGALHKTEAEACRARMVEVYRSLLMYANENDGQFPPSLEEAFADGDARLATRCPGREAHAYLYVPGQTTLSPSDGVLVYESDEPRPAHRGNSTVLRVSGEVELLAPAELDEALAATRAAIAPAP